MVDGADFPNFDISLMSYYNPPMQALINMNRPILNMKFLPQTRGNRKVLIPINLQSAVGL